MNPSITLNSFKPISSCVVKRVSHYLCPPTYDLANSFSAQVISFSGHSSSTTTSAEAKCFIFSSIFRPYNARKIVLIAERRRIKQNANLVYLCLYYKCIFQIYLKYGVCCSEDLFLPLRIGKRIPPLYRGLMAEIWTRAL